jgi:Planctomycete cytochrome C
MKASLAPLIFVTAFGGLGGTLLAGPFETDIMPILKGKCAKCHMEGESKGGLALDAEEISKEIGPSKLIRPGDADNSDMMQCVLLPEDDEDHMPPKGKGQPLTDAEKTKLKEWIMAGAVLGDAPPAATTPEAPKTGMAAAPVEEDWTNAEGKTIRAILVRVDGANAVLKMNGQEIPYPIAKLDSASQERVKAFSAKP